MLDVGGEHLGPIRSRSTVPKRSRAVASCRSIEKPWRLVPVCRFRSTRRKPELPARGDWGQRAKIINDITALLAGDPAMIGVAVETRAAVVAMHMQGTPQTMQDHPSYGDVVAEVLEFLRSRRDTLIAAGIAPERIYLIRAWASARSTPIISLWSQLAGDFTSWAARYYWAIREKVSSRKC